jgi:hypothetical protein
MLTTAKDVIGDFADIRAVSGEVDDIFWYRKGIPRKVRRKGSRTERVEIT